MCGSQVNRWVTGCVSVNSFRWVVSEGFAAEFPRFEFAYFSGVIFSLKSICVMLQIQGL